MRRRFWIVMFVLAPLIAAGVALWVAGGRGPAPDFTGSPSGEQPGGPLLEREIARLGERDGTSKEVPEDLLEARRPEGATPGTQETMWVEDWSSGAEPEVGSPAPDFILPGIDRPTVRLSDWRGDKVVILNFWATWCPPCREEMPHFEALRHQRDDVEIVAVNLYEPPETVEEFLTSLGLSFPVALDRNGDVNRRYLVRPLPTSFIVDRNGVIRGRFFGAMSLEVMNGLVDLALEQETPSHG